MASPVFVTPWARLTRIYQRELFKLFRYFQTSVLSRQTLRDIAANPQFIAGADLVARRMVHTVQKANAISWREAVSKSTHARSIYIALRAELAKTNTRRAIRGIIAENARLIRSIPLDVAQRVSRHALEAASKGARAGQVEKDLAAKLAHLTKSKIRLIARTEISKAQTAITEVRSKQLGISAYVWQSSEDQRVRPSHHNMNGVIVFWDDPPAPEILIGIKSSLGHYQAGCCPQCRCDAMPVVSLDEISWPSRVYSNGSIRKVSRSQFERQYRKAA